MSANDNATPMLRLWVPRDSAALKTKNARPAHFDIRLIAPPPVSWPDSSTAPAGRQSPTRFSARPEGPA